MEIWTKRRSAWRLARGLEEHERAEDVRLDELASRLNRAVDVRLGGEVHDDVRLAHERRRDGRVGDVALDEPVSRAVHHLAQILEAAGVGQLVERRDAPVGMALVRPADEVRSNETGAAGHEHVHECHSRMSFGVVIRPAPTLSSTKGPERVRERSNAGKREGQRELRICRYPLRAPEGRVHFLIVEGHAAALTAVVRPHSLFDKLALQNVEGEPVRTAQMIVPGTYGGAAAEEMPGRLETAQAPE